MLIEICVSSFLDGHNSTFKTLFQLKYIFKYSIFFAKEQSPSPPPQKDKTLVTEQEFVEGDFLLACFPDILPPGLS